MYPYHEFFQVGITETDFKGICAMSSWAICGQRPGNCKEGNGNSNHKNDNDKNNNNGK